jgi:hypothetical protein
VACSVAYKGDKQSILLPGAKAGDYFGAGGLKINDEMTVGNV